MMYRPIVLVVVWSLIFIEIDSWPPRNDHKTITEYTKAIREHFDKELNLLEVVVSYYKKINEQSSSSSQITGIPNDREAVALIQASFFTFWMAVTLRIHSEFNSCIYTNEPEEKHHLCFSEMMFAFIEFKKEIEKYKKNRRKTKSKSVVIDIDSYGNVTVEEAADMILGLSLDFVSSESTLMKMNPDKYENGIIYWNLLEKRKLKRKYYKTVFPSCSIIRRNFHEKITAKDDEIYQSYIQNGKYINKRLDNRFDENTSITFYSSENDWKMIIHDLEMTYSYLYSFSYMPEEIFSPLVDMVRHVINVPKLRRIQNFFVAETLGSKTANIVKETLNSRSWILSTLENTSRIWDTVKEQNFMNIKNNEISTQERIENIIAVVRSIRDVDKMTFLLRHHFIQE